MSVEAHKCNVPECKGYVVFENADFDMKDIPTNNDIGAYAFDDPVCNECGKRFYVVPHYIVIDVTDKELGDYKQLNSACITAVERRQKQIKYECQTDPRKRIEMYIERCGYSYKVDDILRGYREYKTHSYVSYTMKDCISNLESEIKALL